ncbi:MAG TPA: chemotaxis protein CheD [Naasia sp.]|jgi:chemotaxis protein CheD
MSPSIATAQELMVRMGELHTSASAGDVLVSIGLGSCIGLALVDARRPIVGLAHIMLPTADEQCGPKAKFANFAVPHLLAEVRRLGAVRPHAILAGGAQMFSFSGEGGGNIGARNEEAVRDALKAEGIPVRAAATGGRRGRTIRVHVDGTRVTVREVAGTEQLLYGKD